jgi:hypothetical protein
LEELGIPTLHYSFLLANVSSQPGTGFGEKPHKILDSRDSFVKNYPMTPLRAASIIGLMLILAAAGLAQTETAPSFMALAPASCGSGLGYSCGARLTIQDWSATPDYSVCGPLECHLEYCFVYTPAGQTLNSCTTWTNARPTHFRLPATSGQYSVQSAYRVVVANSEYYPRTQGVDTMTLILPSSAPTVTLNSPIGILDPSGDTVAQSQYINGTVGQWVTFTATSPIQTTPLSIVANGSVCGTSCDVKAGQVDTSAPYMWQWLLTSGGSIPADTYVTVTATDDAGNSTTTTPVSTSAFVLFPPGGSQSSLTCDGNATPANCTTLADQADNDVPGDSPSPAVTQCNSPDAALLFSGYADPSMRAEQVATDTYGVDLWLLYSYPGYKWKGTSCSNTTTVETHLASSLANSDANGGATWMAYCGGQTCGSSAPATPVFPSEPYCSGSMTDTYLPQGSQSVTCQHACNEGLVLNGQPQGSNWAHAFPPMRCPTSGRGWT